MTLTNEKMPAENRMIKRGEVYYTNLDDAQGHEQKNDKDTERRLVVVVSNNKQNEQNKVVVIVPLSSKVHNIKPTFQAPTYFQGKPDKAKCEQVRAIDVERLLGAKQGSLTEAEMGRKYLKSCRLPSFPNCFARKSVFLFSSKLKK